MSLPLLDKISSAADMFLACLVLLKIHCRRQFVDTRRFPNIACLWHWHARSLTTKQFHDLMLAWLNHALLEQGLDLSPVRCITLHSGNLASQHFLLFQNGSSEKREVSTVPVHRLARPRRSWVPHSIPGLPQEGEDLQSTGRWPHHRPLQVLKHSSYLPQLSKPRNIWEVSSFKVAVKFGNGSLKLALVLSKEAQCTV